MKQVISVAVAGGLISVCLAASLDVLAQEGPASRDAVSDAVHIVDLAPSSEGRLGWRVSSMPRVAR